MRKFLIIIHRFAILIILIVVVLVMLPKNSMACSTVQPSQNRTPIDTTKYLINTAEVILEGTILTTTPNMGGGESYAFVKVDKYFKGSDIGYGTGFYLHFSCNKITKPGHHAIFYAVQFNYKMFQIDSMEFAGEEIPDANTITQIIEIVGHDPEIPLSTGGVSNTPPTFPVQQIQTPGINFNQTTDVKPQNSNTGAISNTNEGNSWPWGFWLVGVGVLMILVGIVAWVGSRPAE